MSKTPTSVRLSEPGRDKLAALARLYGSQTIAFELALDRLYQQEEAEMEAHITNDYPPMAGKVVTGKTAQDIRSKLNVMLSVDGPRGLTAVTLGGTEIHVELYEGQDYIRQAIDRNDQVHHLRHWAGEIVTWCDDDQATAEQMVAAELENTEVEMPDWFDGHDRGLLVRFVQDALDS